MPRIGMNPFKSIESVAKPSEITVALLVHIPFLSGYYLQSLDVLRLTIGSVVKNTEPPFDLLVFDNGSCPEVRSYLLDIASRGYIQYLALAGQNVGKNGAWNYIFGAAPGKYVVYADGDVFFHPGWLPEHLRLFDAFPEVGTVTGFALRRNPSYCDRSVGLVEGDPRIKVVRGKLIPEQQIDDFISGLGKDPSQYAARLVGVQDTMVQVGDVSAYVSAGHFQFMIPSDLARRFIPLPSQRPVGTDEHFFDEAVEESGCLRLATTRVFVEHLGNSMGSRWSRLMPEYDLQEGKGRRSAVGAGQVRELPLAFRAASWAPIRSMVVKTCSSVMNVCERVMLMYHK